MPIINSIITDTTNITENGTYDVTRYTTANVNVEGTQPTYTTIRISPSTNTETFWPSDFGGDAFESVLAEGVTSDIDSNIQAGNIKKDVQILGVTGTYEGGGGGGPQYYQEYSVASGSIIHSTTAPLLDFSNVHYVSEDYMFVRMYCQNTTITGAVDLSGFQQLTGYWCCYYMFAECPFITSVNLSNLQTVEGAACESMFAWCENLASIDLSSLSYISPWAMQYFIAGTAITSLSLPALDSNNDPDALGGILEYTDGVTLHLPSNLQSWAAQSQDYPNYGGTNVTLLFDLPATE